MTQGVTSAVAAALLLGAAGAQAGCGADAPALQPLAPGVWLVPGSPGDADALNRGRVAHLLLVDDGPRLWLLGSGPTPAAGRALACVVARERGRRVTDVVSPWARPELVLGAGAFGGARHWAHADVAAAMRARCEHCVERLGRRLGAAAADLGPSPISLPGLTVDGDAGVLGPWRWWRLRRADSETVTVWRLAAQPLWMAPGLANGDGPPDGRDAQPARMAASVARLQALVAADGPGARWLGEQGPVQGPAALQVQQAYWPALLATVRQAMEQGGDESAPARGWPGLPAGWATHPWHGFNWQRAWRAQEEAWLSSAPASAAVSAPR